VGVEVSGGAIVDNVMQMARIHLGEPTTLGLIAAYRRIAKSASALAQKMVEEEHVHPQ
jgi:hypothetical protein